MAEASITITDVWAYQSNPAALAEIPKISVSTTYQSRFLLKELQSQAMVYAQPLSRGVVSSGFSLNGNSILRVLRCGIGYGIKLFDYLNAGVQLNYHRTTIAENYGKHASLSAECGVILAVNDRWRIGASVYNLGRLKLANDQDERLPTKMRLGAAVQLSKVVLLCSELEKDLDHPLRFKIGLEYRPFEALVVRAGCAANPLVLSAGFGIRRNSFCLDFATQYHQVLGWSPQVTFSVNGQKKKK